MEFKEFRNRLKLHVQLLVQSMFENEPLYVVDVDGDRLWETYLGSFPPGTNNVFRERREHDCSACRHFIRGFGNVVSIRNGGLTTIWDFEVGDPTYQAVVDGLAALVRGSEICDVFATARPSFGVDHDCEDVDGQIRTWSHFHVVLPPAYVLKNKDEEASERARFRDRRNVFKRSLDEISRDAVVTVLELISQNSLYRGEEWKPAIEKFLTYKGLYDEIGSDDGRNLFVWEMSAKAGDVVGKIRNHSIGVLLTEVSEDADLNEAVRRYEAIVAPTNYKRPKAIFTKKMLADAEAKVTELGLTESLGRRHAVLDDITVNNILFADKDSVKRIAGTVFEDMAQSVAVNPRKFEKVEEVPADTFFGEVLPKVNRVEVLFENCHVPNLVSLIAPKVQRSPSLFKWGNPFSWAYAGNISDSMKERVKAAGGRVDGVLRFSIQWNENGDNPDDLDAHCVEPSGNEIYYVNKRDVHTSSGMLDVDIIAPEHRQVAVENIVWTDEQRMPRGKYRMFVHCYNSRGARSGFTAEVEFEGEVHSFSYNKPLRQGEEVEVAEVWYDRKLGGFEIRDLLPVTTSSRKAWGLDTNQFYPVSVIMYSPNYWNGQLGVGNRHHFFMLKGCRNDESPNGFFNEYLCENLMDHKRVFEALGSKMRVDVVDDQLSGLGFSSTKRSSLVVKVEGRVNRPLKIIF